MHSFSTLVLMSLCLMTVWAFNSSPRLHKRSEDGEIAETARKVRQLANGGRVTTFALPDGYAAEIIIGGVKNTFSCNGRNFGYYADPDNNCVVFHVCVPQLDLENRIDQMFQYSFICANQTLFDQEALVCNHKDDIFPCKDAPSIYDRVNRNFGIVDQPFRI